MENSRPHLFGVLAGLFLACGLCFAALILTRTWIHLHESQVIDVTGSARKNVRSDLALWHASFSTDAPTLLEAQEKLRADLAKVDRWLDQNHLTDHYAHPAQIQEITASHHDPDADNQTRQRIGYRLTQAIAIRSTDVDRLPALASASAELIAQDIAFISDKVEFIYTKSADAKIEMMAEATKDARARADQIAAQGDRTIKELRTARMGVVQINPLYSSATSWEGNSDNSSLEKTIIATVSATFALK